MQQTNDKIPVPLELRSAPHAVLEDYCRSRLFQFSRVFASVLSPTSSQQDIEAAFSKALQLSGGDEEESMEQDCQLRFNHPCRFIGCMSKDCNLCKNNPKKRCPMGDNLDECYADCQVLRSKCEAEVSVELVNSQTGKLMSLPGMEVQVSVIEGESWNEAQSANISRVKELLKSDEGNVLLACAMPGHRVHQSGRIVLKLQNGAVRLPDVNVTDKNDTFHFSGSSYSSFRLMARAVRRDLYGNLQVVESILPAITGKFIVKTQRAISDYRKCEHPHYKDELTKLKFVGNITAQRLRDIQAHMGPNAPFSSINTVEQLKHLILYADQNQQVESKLLELLNMKGKHKHKWDYLRNILLERVVYDDQAYRAWCPDESMSHGLVYACKQAQVALDKPLGLMQRSQQGMQTVLQVFTQPEGGAADMCKAWKAAAEHSWGLPGHPGWSVVTDCMEILGSTGSSISAQRGTSGGTQRPPSSGIVHPSSPPISSQKPQRSPLFRRRPRSSSLPPQTVKEEVVLPDANVLLPFLRETLEAGDPMSVHGSQGMDDAQQEQQLLQQLQQSSAMSQSQSQQLPGPFMMNGSPSPQMLLPASLPTPAVVPLCGAYQFPSFTSGCMAGTSGMHFGQDRGSSQGDSNDVVMGEILQANPHPQIARYACEPPRTNSGRLRRMSADAAGCAQMQTLAWQLTARPAGTSLSDLGKRARTSAPNGLMSTGGNNVVNNTFGQVAARLNLYHYESHGRHLPSRRTCEGRKSPNTSPATTPGGDFDNDADFDQIFSMLDGELEQEGQHQPGGQAGNSCSSPNTNPRVDSVDPFAGPAGTFPEAHFQRQQQNNNPPLAPGRQPHSQPQQQPQMHELPQTLGHLPPHEHFLLQLQLQQAFVGANGPKEHQQQRNQLHAPPPTPLNSSGTDNGAVTGPQRSMSMRLSASMRENLRIRSESPQEALDYSESPSASGSAAAATAAGTVEPCQSPNVGENLLGVPRLLGHSDSDSFRQTMDRVWHNSEPDSFRTLLASLETHTTGGAPPGDHDFDEMLLKNLTPQ